MNQTFLVTGGNAGIGRSTVEGLAKLGARVILAARSEEKARPVISELATKYQNDDLHFLKLNLADLKSIKKSVDDLLASGLISASRPLDVLINNAGLAGAPGLTADGFEITIGTNHLGPYLLTKLLLPELRKAKQGRIVNVASRAHLRVNGIDWNVMREPASTPAVFNRYGVSKLMNVLHVKELARQLKGTSVTTYALHPGVVASEIWREVPAFIRWPLSLFMISNEEGARTSLYCATNPGLSNVSGLYYDKAQETQANPLAEDPVLARKLFEWSEEAIAQSL